MRSVLIIPRRACRTTGCAPAGRWSCFTLLRVRAPDMRQRATARGGITRCKARFRGRVR